MDRTASLQRSNYRNSVKITNICGHVDLLVDHQTNRKEIVEGLGYPISLIVTGIIKSNIDFHYVDLGYV